MVKKTVLILFTFLFLGGCRESKLVTLKTSIPQIEIVSEFRSSIEACNESVKKIENDNSLKECKLISSKKVDFSENTEECIGEASMSGCFVCELECKK